jgi:hypothetical protein
MDLIDNLLKLPKKLAEVLSNTSIKYWTDPSTSWGEMLTFFGASMGLLIVSRSLWHPKSSIHISLMMGVISTFIQFIGCIVYLIRGGVGNAINEVPKFLRLFFVVWIFSLFLSLINKIFLPMAFVNLNIYCLGALYSIPPVILLAYVTVYRERRNNAASRVDYKNIILWSAFIAIINTFLFAFFVVDVNTTLNIETWFG